MGRGQWKQGWKQRPFSEVPDKFAIPERWEEYSNTGNCIPGTRFICMKVPLKQGFCHNLVPEQYFTPKLMVEELKTREIKLGLLIDLTFTKRYYEPTELKRLGIAHAKIMIPGKEVPDYTEVQKFFDVVDNFEQGQADNGEEQSGSTLLIGVHCTHGINRTGYLVCRYLIDRMGWSADEAIEKFNLARGHDIERENYLLALREPISATPSASHDQRVEDSKEISRDLAGMPYRNNFKQNGFYASNGSHRRYDGNDRYPYRYHDDSRNRSSSWDNRRYGDNDRHPGHYQDNSRNRSSSWDNRDQFYPNNRWQERAAPETWSTGRGTYSGGPHQNWNNGSHWQGNGTARGRGGSSYGNPYKFNRNSSSGFGQGDKSDHYHPYR